MWQLLPILTKKYTVITMPIKKLAQSCKFGCLFHSFSNLHHVNYSNSYLGYKVTYLNLLFTEEVFLYTYFKKKTTY